MRINIEIDQPIEGLTKELANSIWQTIIYETPYATGNARSAIRLNSNNKTRINFIYDDSIARYIDFLERGVGPVKKYKGFIANNSVASAMREIVYWAQSGGKTTFSGIPIVVVRNKDDEGKPILPIGYEKKRLNELKRDLGVSITASERAKLSSMYFAEIGGAKSQGKRPQIEKSQFSRNDRIKIVDNKIVNTRVKG